MRPCPNENGSKVAPVRSCLSGGSSGRSVRGGNATADRTGTVLAQCNLVHNPREHLQRLQDVVHGPYQVGAVETERVGGSGEIGDEPSAD